jgi:hypothetical protein
MTKGAPATPNTRQGDSQDVKTCAWYVNRTGADPICRRFLSW